MQCPFCLHTVHPTSSSTSLHAQKTPKFPTGNFNGQYTSMYVLVHTCPNCEAPTIDLQFYGQASNVDFAKLRVFPRSGPFPPAPTEVPVNIATDYAEANEVLPISPKASAALSRRCLQAVLAAQGYAAKNLVNQIDAVLKETDPAKGLPIALRENIDAIRNFGNFSAHPITDQTTLQVLEVEEGEAEWCLQILLDAFDHYYVAPARAAAKRAALGAKLSAAGKPPMK